MEVSRDTQDSLEMLKLTSNSDTVKEIFGNDFLEYDDEVLDENVDDEDVKSNKGLRGMLKKYAKHFTNKTENPYSPYSLPASLILK
jgi:ribosomal protein L30/L7E